ncbi:glycogen synthase [candidate division WWE3 bacterium]|uniref:Glycogen synthase n=1 Tax=candidate division WWE3 bacterium TaxID=2053526 RepID=A0A955LHB9_UNCKA|nr:glycogen synthase [candidate division WWE3 bacterium]
MKVLQIASECTPIIKTGGLADVVGSLPKALLAYGVEAKVALPLYEEIGDKFGHQLKAVSSGSINFQGNEHPYSVFKGVLAEGDIEVYLFQNDEFLSKGEIYYSEDTPHRQKQSTRRFAFFSRAVVDFFTNISDWKPDVMHCHDWHAGIVPHLVKNEYKQDTKTIFTIHNLAMQGVSDLDILSILGHDRRIPDHDIDWDAEDGNIVLLLQGILAADIINTVSPSYAYEITTPQFGEGLDKVLQKNKHKLFGIINGLDYEVWDPKTDEFVFHQYELRGEEVGDIREKKFRNKVDLLAEMAVRTDEDLSQLPMMGIVSRLTRQKGFQLLEEIKSYLLEQKDFTLMVLGTGDDDIERWLNTWEQESPYIIFENKFDEGLAHQIYAASDMFLIPSKFEPCGLTQMISMKYGAIPIVSAVGGLKDTVIPNVNGYVFEEFTGTALLETMKQAVHEYHENKIWDKLVHKALQADFSWNVSAKQYYLLYQKLVGQL